MRLTLVWIQSGCGTLPQLRRARGRCTAVRWTPEAARTSPESSRRDLQSRSGTYTATPFRWSSRRVRTSLIWREVRQGCPTNSKAHIYGLSAPRRISAVIRAAGFGTAPTFRRTPSRQRYHDGRRDRRWRRKSSTPAVGRRRVSYLLGSLIGAQVCCPRPHGTPAKSSPACARITWPTLHCQPSPGRPSLPQVPLCSIAFDTPTSLDRSPSIPRPRRRQPCWPRRARPMPSVSPVEFRPPRAPTGSKCLLRASTVYV